MLDRHRPLKRMSQTCPWWRCTECCCKGHWLVWPNISPLSEKDSLESVGGKFQKASLAHLKLVTPIENNYLLICRYTGCVSASCKKKDGTHIIGSNFDWHVWFVIQSHLQDLCTWNLFYIHLFVLRINSIL